MKHCLYCAEEIQDSAVKCRYCGEWLAAETSREPTPKSPAHPLLNPLPSNEELKGFGGWLCVFLLLQFFPLLKFIGQFGEQVLDRPFVTGWMALGIALGFGLLYEGHQLPVRLVKFYLIANLAIGAIGIWITISNRSSRSITDNAGGIIGASIPSFLWLIYFIRSKRVLATYYGAQSLPEVGQRSEKARAASTNQAAKTLVDK